MAKHSSHDLAKGQHHTVTIGSLAPGGEGVSRELGPPVFVNRVAPGDVVEIELFDVRKDFAKAHVVSIVKASAQRSEPPCSLFKVCGGCQWQHLSYDAQLTAKEDIVRQALKYIGGLNADLVEPIIKADEILYYRNKVQFPVKHPQGSNRILAGYYKQDSHELVNVKHCPVQPQPLDYILEVAKDACERHGISAYSETKHTGLLRHINMRFSFNRKTALVTLVLNASAQTREELEELPFFERLKKAADEIVARVDEAVGVTINLNNRRGNKILGDQNYCIAGEDHIIEVLATTRIDLPERLMKGLEFSLSATSFFQINTSQAVRLLELVYDCCSANKEQLDLQQRKPVIIDAYCGVGTISLWLAPLAERVIAIEEHPEAVEDGRRNARLNNIDNIEYYLGQVEQVLPRLASEGLVPDIVVIDPPRKGVAPEVLDAIINLSPRRIVYVSCNPSTLARDLKILEQHRRLPEERQEKNRPTGYKTKQVRPVDLFPQTYHVESVSVIERI